VPALTYRMQDMSRTDIPIYRPSGTADKYSNLTAQHRPYTTGTVPRAAPTTSIDHCATRSHRGGHRFDRSIAHPAPRPVAILVTGLPPDSLELLPVELSLIKVDLIPGQAEDFASAQAEDEDQDEEGVKRFTGMPGRFEEPPCVINGPGLAPAVLPRLAALCHRDRVDGVTSDLLIVNCAS
jgi:hypothetical protein